MDRAYVTRARGNPEEQLQISCVRFLREHLPQGVIWTSSLSGLRLPIQVAVRAKASGLNRGWADLSFAIPGVGVRLAELKAGAGLSLEQRALRDILQPLGHWILARSVLELAGGLTDWGVKLETSAVWP